MDTASTPTSPTQTTQPGVEQTPTPPPTAPGVPSTRSGAVINEVLFHPDDTKTKAEVNGGPCDIQQSGVGNSFVELYNGGAGAVDLSDHVLKSWSGVYYKFPQRTVLGPQQYMVIRHEV